MDHLQTTLYNPQRTIKLNETRCNGMNKQPSSEIIVGTSIIQFLHNSHPSDERGSGKIC